LPTTPEFPDTEGEAQEDSAPPQSLTEPPEQDHSAAYRGAHREPPDAL
jgi:hypothetical protein